MSVIFKIFYVLQICIILAQDSTNTKDKDN